MPNQVQGIIELKRVDLISNMVATNVGTRHVVSVISQQNDTDAICRDTTCRVPTDNTDIPVGPSHVMALHDNPEIPVRPSHVMALPDDTDNIIRPSHVMARQWILNM